MAENDFLPFAADGGADVMPQADYLAAAFRGAGFATGIAIPAELNKVWRQSAFVAACVAQVMADLTDEDVLDDGDTAAFVALLKSTLQKNGTAIPDAVIGAAHTYTPADSGAVIRRSNGGAAMIDIMPGTEAEILPAGTSITVQNVDPTAILAIKPGTAVALSGSLLAFVLLGPKQSCTFVSDGDATYYIISGGGRCRLGAATSIFVDPAGDDADVGITAATPMATLQVAADRAQQYFDLNGHVIKVKCADGNYGAGADMAGAPLLGAETRTGLVFEGNPGNPAACVINSVGACFSTYGVEYLIDGFHLTSSGSSCVVSGYSGSVTVQNVRFAGAAAGYHMLATVGGQININGNYAFVGNAISHIHANNNGLIAYGPGITITGSGTPNFSGEFARCTISASISAPNANITWAGTGATGNRYNASLNGVIYTAGGGANFFPGSVAGSTATGGQYA